MLLARRLPSGAWLLWLISLFAQGAAAQQPVAIIGRLLDAGTGTPIQGASVTLADRASGAITDSLGIFRFAAILPGPHVLRVSHIAYGSHAHAVTVPQERNLEIELRLSPEALELEPIEVESARRGRPSANVVTREQIESLAGRARHIGDVVRAHIPGAVVTEATGGYLCIEFRGGANSRTTGCNYPLIVVDGLPIAEAGRFLRDLRVSDIERIEFVPASEGSARYGMGATYGVLVIESRRSGLVTQPPQQPRGRPRYPAYPWSSEPGGHPVFRALGGATVGLAAGMAVGLAAVGCFPGQPESGGSCVQEAGHGAGLSALLLPLVGTTLGARFLGSTAASRGKLLPSLAMSAFPAALGYGLYVEGVKADFNGERALGAGLVVVATPLVATLADHLFRTRRRTATDSSTLR